MQAERSPSGEDGASVREDLGRLNIAARQVAAGDYTAAKSIFDMTSTGKDVPEVAPRLSELEDLAETIGLMIVKIEGREYLLEMALEEQKRQNDELKRSIALRSESGFVLCGIFIIFAAYIVSLYWMLFHQILDGWTKTKMMIACNILILVVSAIYVKLHRHPLAERGLTLDGAMASIRESLLFSIPLAVIGIGLKAFLVGSPCSPFYGEAVFAPVSPAWLVLYMPIVVLQEISARGFLQTSITRIVPERSSAKIAIVATSLLFAVTHIFYSMESMVSTFAGSLFFGWLFYRQRCLAGVILAHYILGVLYAFSLRLICW